MPLTINVDDRESAGHPNNVIMLRHLGHKVTVKRMEFADYAMETEVDHPKLGRPSRIGIELSTISDVVGKINAGRLHYQLSGLIESYDVPILLIEQPAECNIDGTLRIPGSPVKFPFERFQKTLFSAACYGVIVMNCRDRSSVVDTITYIGDYWNKPAHTAYRKDAQGVIPETTLPLAEPIDRRVRTLMTLPGIGETRALELLKTYRSLKLIFNMNISGFKAIDGIGAGTAQKVVQFIETDVSPGDAAPMDLFKGLDIGS